MTRDTGGASRFWTSTDPAVIAAREAALRGELRRAADLLVRSTDTRAAQEGQQVLAWIRRDYEFDATALLDKVRPQIPDVTPADLHRWREQGELQHRWFDGQLGYFRSEPANLFRFCAEARNRRTTAPLAGDWRLEQHLERVVQIAVLGGPPLVVPIRQQVELSLTIPAESARFRAGALVRAWLAFPQTLGSQQDVRLVQSEPAAAFVAPDGTPQRSVYFEHRVTTPGEPVRFAVTVGFSTAACCPLLTGTAASLEPPTPADRSERPPHVVFSPALRRAVAEAIEGETDPLSQARRIFDWVFEHITYNAEEEYGIIPSLAEHALARRRGDCGVQAMLFIAMCRCVGIPARWQSGWQTQRHRWNMHDWCEFFVEPFGWLPADPSYGWREHVDPRVRSFYFGNLDAYRMVVSRDYGRDLVPPKASLRSEPLDFQRGEVEVDGENLYFDRWQWNFEPLWLDPGP